MSIVRHVLTRPKSFWFTVVALAIWLAVVITLTSYHEFRRDEVRAFSLARAARWPWELFSLIRYDGHPVVWYALLYLGTCIVNSPLVLPIISIAIALGAVALFFWRSPFPAWFKVLFIFCGLPVYEYSVSARNYGISLLLIVVVAVLYPHRTKHSVWLAIVLGLLANTNVHSAIIVGAIATLWFVDLVRSERVATSDPIAPSDEIAGLAKSAIPFAIIAAGIALCALTTWPTENTILTSAHRAFRPGALALSTLTALFRPDLTFKNLVPELLSPIFSAVPMALAVLGLLRRPPLLLAALAAQVLLGVLFLWVYAGSYRHEGLFIAFLLFLYWQYCTRPQAQGRLFKVGFYAGVSPLIAFSMALGWQLAWQDVRYELSSNRILGQLIARTPIYHQAILMAEPDYVIESLPYYADNPLYLPREGRFNNVVSWTTASAERMSLGQLLDAAQHIQQREGRPVLLVLGHLEILEADKQQAGEIRYSYNKTFSWLAEDWSRLASVQRVARFDEAMGDEVYEVYVFNESRPIARRRPSLPPQ
jgi:hypothetical protein